MSETAWDARLQRAARLGFDFRMLSRPRDASEGDASERDVATRGAAERSARRVPVRLLPEKPAVRRSASGEVIQRKMGFELEMLALVDVDGRPAPEKHFLGSYGAENLELQVDQNGSVEGDTPLAPADANFQVARRLPTVANPNPNWRNLGAYDLPAGWETRVSAQAGAAPGADPRQGGLNFNMLDAPTWQAGTATNRFSRPPAPNNTGLVNTDLPFIDAAIQEYATESKNWEPARARGQLNVIINRATQWLAANNAPPAAGNFLRIARNRRRGRYIAAQGTIQNLLNEAQQHLAFWALPANAAVPAGLERQYHRPAAGAAAAVPWGARHPLAGGGGDRYASILEIVTRPYEPETAVGRAGLINALTEADQLAAAIEGATTNFANRAQLNTIANTNILNPQTYVGSDTPTRSPQTTDASIQSTFGLDLTQIGSFIKTSVAPFLATQNRFGLGHQADVGATPANPGGVNRAEVEMSRAVVDATRVINDVKGQIGAGTPNFVNLRGLVILMAQYLRMGKYWTGPGIRALDKNLTDLLSRTDLAHIYRDLVPAAEKAWLNAAPANMQYLVARVFHHTGRNAGSLLLNEPTEGRVGGGGPQFTITCTQFVDNVLTQANDGVTQHWGGFQQRPAEDIDPAGAHRNGDTRPATAVHRMAPVFELRNMLPKLNGRRFPRADWVPLATSLAETIELLNQRTEAQAVSDARAQEGIAAPPPPAGHVVGLRNPDPAW